MLKILGDQTLRSLRLERHAIEKTRFLRNLQRDLPGWLLCHYCSMFRPIDQNGGPSQRWRYFDERECARVNGVVSIGFDFHLRYEHAQLLMRNYRLGRPHKVNLERLSHRFAEHRPETSRESVVSANIVAGELLLEINHTLLLLKNWDISLIRANIPNLCTHLVIQYRDTIFEQTLRCRLSHANRLPCPQCKRQKHCLECSTSFLLDIRTLKSVVTEVRVDVWRCLGSCERPFESQWGRQADGYLPDVSKQGRRT